MNTRIGVSGFLLCLLYCPSPVQGEENSLCALAETKIASCETTKGKLVSICSGNNKVDVYYRFGELLGTELEVKFRQEKKLYRWLDLNTYITFLGFENGGYLYVFGVPQETLGARAFLNVRKAGSAFTYEDTFTCNSNSFGDKTLASQVITDVADDLVRTKEGLVFPPR
ncbi:hypothetical protein [Pseudomonas palleroniana]|uniref:hypothetical protein n=1 Tax=Pseudomonas palleroniana TaxID=191390 RepID=UPI0011AE1C33|nr:hypothetical protein [Pseudomonas palleroniana]UOK35910.1 hypothetical protein MJP36_15410 [Pseudomonas palleroniana]UOP10614.1 hypothetical protein LDL65_26670 [Pseudomonas palleroniana]